MMTFPDISNLHWREPLWLLVSLQPFIFLIAKKIFNKKTAILYADKNLLPWVIFPQTSLATKNIINKNTVYVVAWFLFAIALAGPRTVLYHPDKEKSLTTNIMLVVDASLSMQARDIVPNRLQRAKLEIHELLNHAPNHRIGITVFSARPHLYVPLTYDYSALSSYLDNIDKLEFPTSGSNLYEAILLAHKELIRFNTKSVIILFTDGDLPESFKTHNQEIINVLRKTGTALYILGLGTVEGEAIQTKDGKWVTHNNKTVVSKLNETVLEQLATENNGKYSVVYDDNTDWKILYENGVANINTNNKISENNHIIWNELFYYFLFSALILFWIALAPYQLKSFSRAPAIVFVILFILFPDKELQAFEIFKTDEKIAFEAYNSENYALASKLFLRLNNYQGHYGSACSLYRQGHYKKAIQHFTFSISYAASKEQKVAAIYNLANSYFRTGQFSEAITTYQDVLNYDPGHKASKYNIAISKILRDTIARQRIENEKHIQAPRQGRGARSASLENGSEISNNASLSLNKNSNNQITQLPDIPEINNDVLNKLIADGLKNISLATNQSESSSETAKYSANNNYDESVLDLKINILADSQSLLWKRIFELEEGFPAPVETPHQLPGVNPW